MGRTPYQVFKVAAPVKNAETGEICEDVVVCIKCSPYINEETGELERKERSTFKIPFENNLPVEKKKIEQKKCDRCKRSRRSFILILMTLAMVLPAFATFLYLAAETFLHHCIHKYHNQGVFRSRIHSMFYSEFCAFCQSDRSMDLIGKLQDERMVKMRKYVRNIPIQ